MGGADWPNSCVELGVCSSRYDGPRRGRPRRKVATEAARSRGPRQGPGPSGAGPTQALPLIGGSIFYFQLPPVGLAVSPVPGAQPLAVSLL